MEIYIQSTVNYNILCELKTFVWFVLIRYISVTISEQRNIESEHPMLQKRFKKDTAE
jgi:hypothetical protein